MNKRKLGKDLYHVKVDFSDRWEKIPITKKEKYLDRLRLSLKHNFPEYSWIVTDERINIESISPIDAPELYEVDELYNHQKLMLDNMKSDGNTIIETSRQSGSTHVLLEYIKHILENNEGYLIRYTGSPRRADVLHMLHEKLNPTLVSQTNSTLTFFTTGTYKPNKVHVLSPDTHHMDHSDIRGCSYNGVIDVYDNNRIIDSQFWERLKKSNDVLCHFACNGNFKFILTRTGQPDPTYRKILLTGRLNDLYFANRLKLDYTEIALLNKDQENPPDALPNMFRNQKYSELKYQIGEKCFNREHRLHLDLDGGHY